LDKVGGDDTPAGYGSDYRNLRQQAGIRKVAKDTQVEEGSPKATARQRERDFHSASLYELR
jgi:hypothetical protein